ncbi:plastocyanin/azurin family copper-binding protein [Pontibacillus sp. HMF3514]|uniref:plastocyanin/azurin family copper-binding protein n=1 Tax=Pontibacillus sp. HMF3514 TaxID=2692425 RepID=UPI00131FDBBB|nr:plastocyanin/azurin family copper-binding protein [Pontibacillus sp. HMF3514]QHE52355.1 hypothetical protein GS400_10030 [Pontibacillus sp. HMF3514]
MFKNKKSITIIGIALLAVLLTACSNSNSNASNDNQEPKEETKQEDAEKDEATSNDSDKSNEDKETKKESKDGVIEISAFEMGYDPDSITLKKGKEYELELTNDGSVFHDLTSSDLKAKITFKGEMPDHPENVSFIENIFGVNKVHAEGGHDDGHSDDQQDGDSHGDGHGHSEQTLHMNAKKGQTVRVKFIPKEVGEYEFFCSIPGHKEAGMVGKIKVVE